MPAAVPILRVPSQQRPSTSHRIRLIPSLPRCSRLPAACRAACSAHSSFGTVWSSQVDVVVESAELTPLLHKILSCLDRSSSGALPTIADAPPSANELAMTPDYTRSRRIDRPQAQDVVQARGWAPSAYTPMPRATPAASCRAQRRTVAAAAPSAESASFVCAWSGRVRTRHQGRHRRAGAPPSVLCFCRLSSQTTSSSQALRLCRTVAGDMAAQPNDCRRRAGGAGCMPSWWACTLRRAADRRDRSDKGAHARSDAGVQAAHSEKPMRLARRCCTARCQQPWHSMLTTPFRLRPSESPQCYAMVEPARISAVWRYRQTLPAFVSS